MVDDCRYLGATNISTCRQVSLTPDDDERLNIVAPVQIGGVAPLSNGQQYPNLVPTAGLNGCIRNLVVCLLAIVYLCINFYALLKSNVMLSGEWRSI